MTEEQFAQLTRLVLAPLKSFNAQVFLFGSRSTGQHHPHSDVDLLYKGEISIQNLSQIKEAIEESQFPFAVELVSESELAESYRASVKSQLIEL